MVSLNALHTPETCRHAVTAMPRDMTGTGRYPPQPKFKPISFYSAVRLGDPEQLATVMSTDPYFITQDNGAGAPIHFATTYKQLDMVSDCCSFFCKCRAWAPRNTENALEEVTSHHRFTCFWSLEQRSTNEMTRALPPCTELHTWRTTKATWKSMSTYWYNW